MKTLKSIEIHMIQAVPTVVNRNQSSEPKYVEWGGTRGYISSQALKYAVRVEGEGLGDVKAVRTKFMVGVILDKLKNTQGGDAEIIKAYVERIFGSMKEDALTNSVFLGEDEIQRVVDFIDGQIEANRLEFSKAKTKTKATLEDAVIKMMIGELSNSMSVEVALFGRMMASNKDWNVDAAAYFSDTITTHNIVPNSDFFTQRDDVSNGTEHIGDLLNAPAVHYRMCSVDMGQLERNLGGSAQAAQAGVARLLDQVIKTLPKGKSHGKFGHTLPGWVLVQIKEGAALSYANAFIKPVQNNAFLFENSVDKLEKHILEQERVYGLAVPQRFVIAPGREGSTLVDTLSTLPEVIAALGK